MPELDPAWRDRNVGRLLFAATALFLREKLKAAADGGLELAEAQCRLLQNLDRDGTRLTRLAARAIMPKQSMSEAVDAAELSNLVERQTDPQDRRAKIVTLTATGRFALRRLSEAVAEAERRMAQVIGATMLASIKTRLGEYVAASDLSMISAADQTLRVGTEGWSGIDAGRMMVLTRRLFVSDVLQVVREGGADFTEVRLALFRALDLGGTRLTDLAARAGMTKPAMAEIVDKAGAAGLITRLSDPADGRAKIVSLTAQGRRVLDLMGAGVGRAEARLAAVTDPVFVEDLRASLKAYTCSAQDAPASAPLGISLRVQDAREKQLATALAKLDPDTSSRDLSQNTQVGRDLPL